jgi:hypothetical protein
LTDRISGWIKAENEIEIFDIPIQLGSLEEDRIFEHFFHESALFRLAFLL